MIRAEIDGSAVTGRENLHELLAEQLALPEWYGKNLDALFDCLTEPGEEIFLVVHGWEALEETLGGYARTVLRLLEEAARTGNRFHYVLAGGGEGERTDA